MNDIDLEQAGFSIDFSQSSGEIITAQDLENAVIISLLTNKAVEEPIDENKGGWWGDVFPSIENDKYGSHLWTLSREKAIPETAIRAKEIVEDALSWMIEDGVASKIEVETEFIKKDTLGIHIKIFKPTGDLLFNYQYAWDAQQLRRSF